MKSNDVSTISEMRNKSVNLIMYCKIRVGRERALLELRVDKVLEVRLRVRTD